MTTKDEMLGIVLKHMTGVTHKMDFVSDDQRKAVFAAMADDASGPNGLKYISPAAKKRAMQAESKYHEADELEEMWRKGKTSELRRRDIYNKKDLDEAVKFLRTQAQELDRGNLADVDPKHHF